MIIPKKGETVTPEGLIAYCRGRVARFETPKAVYFMDALPVGRHRQELQTGCQRNGPVAE